MKNNTNWYKLFLLQACWFFLSLGNTSTVHLATKTKTAHKKVIASVKHFITFAELFWKATFEIKWQLQKKKRINLWSPLMSSTSQGQHSIEDVSDAWDVIFL